MTNHFSWTNSNSRAGRPLWISIFRSERSRPLLTALGVIVGIISISAISASRDTFRERPEGDVSISPPRLILSDAEKDIGTVQQGSIVRAVFPLRNAGKRRLVVFQDSQLCCGAAPAPATVIVEAGRTGTLTVELNTSQWHGLVEHVVSCTTNDPVLPRFNLKVTGEVTSGTRPQGN